MNASRPAAEVIDEIRAQYKRREIDRRFAILHIQAQVRVTEHGAADLLDHPEDARERYRR